MAALRRFTLELSRPGGGWSDLQAATARARSAAQQMQREGIPVRFLRSVFVPEDDACFFLYEAASAHVVRDATRRAALGGTRVSTAITMDSGEER